jgi:diguanylate cyclase (GGDEF)-like protein
VNISIVSPQGKIESYKGGNIYPYSQRAKDHYLINFNHFFESGVSTVYIQVKTRDPFIVSISMMDELAFLKDQVTVSTYTGLIYGGILAMVFYNLFLFLGIRKPYYAYYVLYLFAFFIMNASYNGYTFMYVLSNYPTLQNWLQSFSIFFFMLAGLLFANSFLNLEKYHYTLYKITRYLIFIIIVIALLSAILVGYHYHVMFSIIVVIVVSMYIVGVALFSFLSGNRAARFFLLGASSGLIGAMITALTVMSFIPYNYMTYKANDFGMFIDVILLSLALADRVKITLEEKLKAEKEAKTDIVTGLYNRRAYYEICNMEYERLVRHHRILSVIMFDIDHFKTINDRYGHDTGDMVLSNVARIVREVIREYDFAFRMGGDEFLLLLPETSEAKACILAERIRTNIEDQKILDKNHNKFSITASFGIAQYSHKDKSIGDVTRKADEALYQAKKAGRNRIEVLDKFAII